MGTLSFVSYKIITTSHDCFSFFALLNLYNTSTMNEKNDEKNILNVWKKWTQTIECFIHIENIYDFLLEHFKLKGRKKLKLWNWKKKVIQEKYKKKCIKQVKSPPFSYHDRHQNYMPSVYLFMYVPLLW